MTLAIEGGFLVEEYARDGRTRRLARIVEGRPEGASRAVPVTTRDGRRYVTGWVYSPGVRQGRAVAWPAA